MNTNDYGFLKMRGFESSTGHMDRRTAGADLLHEATRQDYLIGKDRVLFAEATGHGHLYESGGSSARSLVNLPVSGDDQPLPISQ